MRLPLSPREMIKR